MTLDVLREAAQLTESGEPVGLATLVATRGSTPQKVGARLLARAGQRPAGPLGRGGGGGGGRAEEEAALAATGGTPAVREYVLSTGVDDWGLACGGTMLVFVERLDRHARGWLSRAIQASEGRDAVAIVMALDGPGAGARLVVAEGEVTGALADAALTSAAAALGRRALRAEAPQLRDSRS